MYIMHCYILHTLCTFKLLSISILKAKMDT